MIGSRGKAVSSQSTNEPFRFLCDTSTATARRTTRQLRGCNVHEQHNALRVNDNKLYKFIDVQNLATALTQTGVTAAAKAPSN